MKCLRRLLVFLLAVRPKEHAGTNVCESLPQQIKRIKLYINGNVAINAGNNTRNETNEYVLWLKENHHGLNVWAVSNVLYNEMLSHHWIFVFAAFFLLLRCYFWVWRENRIWEYRWGAHIIIEPSHSHSSIHHHPIRTTTLMSIQQRYASTYDHQHHHNFSYHTINLRGVPIFYRYFFLLLSTHSAWRIVFHDSRDCNE